MEGEAAGEGVAVAVVVPEARPATSHPVASKPIASTAEIPTRTRGQVRADSRGDVVERSTGTAVEARSVDEARSMIAT